MRRLLWFFLIGTALAQNWSGILSPPRAADWSKAGVQGGIPSGSWTQCGATIAAYTGPATTINNALTACGANQFVKLGTGTFNLTTQLAHIKDSTVLRGNGADLTKIIAGSGSDGGGCGFFFSYFIRMCKGNQNQGTTAGGASGPQNTATWTGTLGTVVSPWSGSTGANLFPQGANQITLSAVTNLFVGDTIMLDQTDDASDGWPVAGEIWECSNSPACSSEGGNSWARVGRVHVEYHVVTAINQGGCGATCVTIDPPIVSPDYRSAKTPQAWWGSASTLLSNVGIEDLSIDFSADAQLGILMENIASFWMKGVRIIHTGGPGSFLNHVTVIHGFRGTVKDSYWYGPTVQGNTQYTYTVQPAGSMLFENNILHHNVTPIAANDPEVGSVYAYNYVDDAFYSSGPQPHNAGDLYNLWEGNDWGTLASDNIHGTHFFNAYYRNASNGHQHNQGGVAYDGGFVLLARNRFANMLGNVLGSSAFTRYEADQIFQTDGSCTNCGVNNSAVVWSFGWKESSTANDPNVKTKGMRWWNWDSVTSTNDTGTNDQTGTRCVSGEVPTGIANFPNSLPATCGTAYPASFYLNVKPSWFGSIAWPPIGPDVTSGNAPNTSSFPTGGHANKIPARACFESLANDPAYPSSNPRIKVFNASACYATVAAPAVQFAPTSLTFAATNVGTTTSEQTVTLTNTGTANLVISSIVISGDFNVGPSNTCTLTGLTVVPAGTCVLAARFLPTFTGTRAGAITVADNASGSPHVVTLTGSGTLAPQIKGNSIFSGVGVVK
jgi:hypothetical protein